MWCGILPLKTIICFHIVRLFDPSRVPVLGDVLILHRCNCSFRCISTPFPSPRPSVRPDCAISNILVGLCRSPWWLLISLGFYRSSWLLKQHLQSPLKCSSNPRFVIRCCAAARVAHYFSVLEGRKSLCTVHNSKTLH